MSCQLISLAYRKSGQPRSSSRVDGSGSRYDGGVVFFTLETLMAPFLAPAKARVERRQDLANMVGNLAEAWDRCLIGEGQGN